MLRRCVYSEFVGASNMHRLVLEGPNGLAGDLPEEQELARFMIRVGRRNFLVYHLMY